jgi:tRNA dimethylallyltransferase
VLVVGPTAGGKTALAVELALRLPGGGECIGADSMQVYRGLDIGTAKPTAAERRGVPHHLLDVADPARAGYSVDTWLAEAERLVPAIRGRGRHPIVVGGTSLYVQAFLGGLADGPAPDPALRRRLADTDAAELRRWLERVDPAAAGRIHPNDRKRTIRAIEVHELTGRPVGDGHEGWVTAPPRADVMLVGLDHPAEAINRRINDRVRAMLEAGLVDEVRRLHAAGSLGPQASEALGYKQILEVLAGRTSLEDAVEQIKIRTRRYAKQQRTWLRRFRRHRPAIWLAAAELTPQELVDQALEAIAGWTPEAGDPAPERAAGGPGAAAGP